MPLRYPNSMRMPRKPGNFQAASNCMRVSSRLLIFEARLVSDPAGLLRTHSSKMSRKISCLQLQYAWVKTFTYAVSCIAGSFKARVSESTGCPTPASSMASRSPCKSHQILQLQNATAKKQLKLHAPSDLHVTQFLQALPSSPVTHIVGSWFLQTVYVGTQKQQYPLIWVTGLLGTSVLRGWAHLSSFVRGDASATKWRL